MSDITADLISIPPLRTNFPEWIFFRSTQQPTLQSSIRIAAKDVIDTLDPLYVNQGSYNYLWELRRAIRDYPSQQVEEAKIKTNPFEGLGNNIFMNRAGLKIAALDALLNFDLTYHIGAFMHLTTPGQLKFCALADAPGAFTQYIQWRRPESIGYGISLKSTTPGVPDWNTRLLDSARFFTYYGASDTGDLYREWSNFAARVINDQSKGVDLVVADGGFDVDREKKYRVQEFVSFHLILVQLLTALSVLKTPTLLEGKPVSGGNFVVKVFESVTSLTAQLIYLASLCFDEIALIKPISSRPGNDEKYLVCRGRKEKSITIKYEQILATANSSYNEDDDVVNIIDSPLPDDFVAWLTQWNDRSVNSITSIAQAQLDFLQGKKTQQPKYNFHQAYMLWCLPSKPLPKRGLGVPVTSSRGYG